MCLCIHLGIRAAYLQYRIPRVATTSEARLRDVEHEATSHSIASMLYKVNLFVLMRVYERSARDRWNKRQKTDSISFASWR